MSSLTSQFERFVFELIVSMGQIDRRTDRQTDWVQRVMRPPTGRMQTNPAYKPIKSRQTNSAVSGDDERQTSTELTISGEHSGTV